ncbi:hypothetical protein PF002_g17575 [Phytophthora fragariae]|uniref:Uncharacterized protein n=3 Tax=Phytophthora TaxID=4783 RepID=A0A6A4CZ22_9STRA|nr:hypothetical protein PF009_g17499 [Phytophthora fragariae]KAE9214731.1 hypothetical protein PF002_g17575 [Phytophthora fragariae]KAE9299241.1 hypothetical protein PF001_g15525 [Phytophthora fragariae]
MVLLLGGTDQVYGPHYRPFKKRFRTTAASHILPLIHATAALVFVRESSIVISHHFPKSSAEQPRHHQNMPTKKPAKPTAGVGTPRANALTTVPFTGEPPSPPASSAVTTRAASHDRTRTKQPFVDYQSPLKKLRTAMRLRRVIDTIDGTMQARRALDSA